MSIIGINSKEFLDSFVQ
jgi:hypothetical protein